MKKHLLFFLFIACISCSDKEPSSGINIRIQNNSRYRFDKVFVNTSGGENNYGSVLSRNSSAYLKFNQAYQYANIRLTINGQEFAFQPYDYFGETPLPEGKYTYILNVNNLNSRTIDLQFRKD